MGDRLGRRLAGMAGAALFAASVALSAGSAGAQPTFTSGNWATDDGGSVEVTANGTFNAVYTDATTKASVFATGKVISRKPVGDKLELTLKPAAPVAGVDTLIIDVAADGNGELLVVSGGERHHASSLTK